MSDHANDTPMVLNKLWVFIEIDEEGNERLMSGMLHHQSGPPCRMVARSEDAAICLVPLAKRLTKKTGRRFRIRVFEVSDEDVTERILAHLGDEWLGEVTTPGDIE